MKNDMIDDSSSSRIKTGLMVCFELTMVSNSMIEAARPTANDARKPMFFSVTG